MVTSARLDHHGCVPPPATVNSEPLQKQLATAFGNLNLLVNVPTQFSKTSKRSGVELISLVREIDGYIFLNNRGRAGENDNSLTQIDRFVNVVGDKQHCYTQGLPDIANQILQVGSCLSINCREGLVHEKNLGLIGDGSCDRNSLLHAARKLPRVALGNVRQADRVQSTVHQFGRSILSTRAFFRGSSTLSYTVIQGKRLRPYS